MELVQYVKWTKEGERKHFLELAKIHQNDSDLVEAVVNELKVDRLTAMIAVTKMKEKIKELKK